MYLRFCILVINVSIKSSTNPKSHRKKKHTEVWPCGKNAGLQKIKTGNGSQKGEKERKKKTKEDLGGLCD
jgi:hypothetical protein